jgi:UDP-2-acetamido-3-amino-2,3-dideoxy-glucuronate N-acetyltransferase
LQAECEHFLESVREGRRPRTDARDGIGVLRVLDAARRSMKSGCPTTSKVDIDRSHFFAHESAWIDEGCEIGEGTKIWHFSHVLEGSEIGRHCVIGQNVAIGPDVRIGDGCKIQNNVSLYKGVVLGADVFCGPSCVFTNVNNPRADIERKKEFRPTIFGRGATIGANATIVCGHRLGRYCFVAAGSVVTHDVPPHALIAGNPARQIGWVSHAGERLTPDLKCPRTGRRYMIDDQEQLSEIVDVKETA